MEPRFCTNCRAELPENAEACPACGVFAGELYDERMHRPRTRVALFAPLLIVALAAGGAAVWWSTQRSLPERSRPADAPRTRVVGDRPGGARRAPGAVVNQAQAIRLVRRHLVVSKGIKRECIVLLGEGFQKGAYVVTARDHCASTRLGKWRVNGKTGDVTPAL